MTKEDKLHGFSGPESTDAVNPQHYKRGPVECITVTREIRDFRLASAMKYLWRVSFQGKENDAEDIRKAMWYLNDFVQNPPKTPNWRES